MTRAERFAAAEQRAKAKLEAQRTQHTKLQARRRAAEKKPCTRAITSWAKWCRRRDSFP